MATYLRGHKKYAGQSTMPSLAMYGPDLMFNGPSPELEEP